MAVKSEIKIDVDSVEFQAFLEKFEKYSALLETIPDTWKSIQKTTEGSKTNFEESAALVATTAGSMSAIASNTKEFYHVTIGRTWHTRPAVSQRTLSQLPSPILNGLVLYRFLPAALVYLGSTGLPNRFLGNALQP